MPILRMLFAVNRLHPLKDVFILMHVVQRISAAFIPGRYLGFLTCSQPLT